MNMYDIKKTTLFASLIVAMILPVSGMNFTYADSRVTQYLNDLEWNF